MNRATFITLLRAEVAAGRLSFWLAAVLCGSLFGCSHRPAPAADAGEVVRVLTDAARLADLGRLVAEGREDGVACLITGGLAATLNAAAEAVAGAPALPTISVDVSSCLDFDLPPMELVVPDTVERDLDLTLRVTGLALEGVAARLPTHACQLGRARVAVAWVGGLASVVLDEITEPDGRLQLDGLPFGDCP